MIESKLIVGRYINFVMPLSPDIALGAFHTQAPILKTIEESSGIRVKTSNVNAGTGVKAHRNFQWLNWAKGGVNQVVFGGTDVLTGPMGGCWIVNYKIAGIEYVGHVGTFMRPDSPESIAAKGAWNHFANANPLQVLGGFKPGWIGNFPARIKGDLTTGQTMFGLVTQTEYYTVFAWRKDTRDGYRIAGIQRCVSSPLVTLQNI